MRCTILAVTSLVAALLLVTSASARVAIDVPYWQATKHCEHGYSQHAAKRGIAGNLRTHEPLTRQKGRRVWRYAHCALTRQQTRARGRYVHRLRHWRHKYENVWPIRFNRLPAGDRGWAESTSSCEAGMNPATNTGNGFYGAFQFVLSTWHAAGGSGYPNQHSWHYQAVIAVHWMHIAGAGQWPVCG